MSEIEIRHFHMCCGSGGGKKGFNRGTARVGRMVAVPRCIGGVDNDPDAIEDFNAEGGAAGTVLDLFTREQYRAFHGHEPPEGWREATPADIIRAAHNLRPHVIFMSAPCKGFSGLTSETKSREENYVALNELALRCVWLCLEAWKDDPVEFILFENVPRIMHRGRPLLEHIQALYRAYGYVYAETTHDCGELGNLAQSRNRFLMVSRNAEKVPSFLYEPPRRPLRAVGDVLSRLPMPGTAAAASNPLHRLPRLQWKTWVRLAFVQAGKDWRSLNRLRVVDGELADFGIVPDTIYRNDAFGVKGWEQSAGTITGNGRPAAGAFSVADPRFDPNLYDCSQYGVQRWDQTARTVIGLKSPGQGGYSVADPRVGHGPSGPHFSNVYRVVRWDQVGPTISSGHGPSAGGMAVADPRPGWDRHQNALQVGEWDKPTGTIIGGGKGVQGGWGSIADPRLNWGEGAHGSKLQVQDWDGHAGTITGARFQSGAQAVADPRPGLDRGKGDHYLTCGHYGVIPWDRPSNAVTGAGRHDNGFGNVADPRLPAPADRLNAIILAEDGTYHRPFSTLENGALQSYVDLEEWADFRMAGNSESRKRERIGNMVPPDTAQAIASQMYKTLLLAWSGETFILSNEPVWVREQIIAISCGSAA
jgi:site-specific DNA-cytosine methylase